MKPVFFTNSGWLTPYAMACGYLHSQGDGDARLSSLDGGGYEVSISRFGRFASAIDSTFQGNANTAYVWPESLSDARKIFRKVCGKLEQRYESNPEVARSVYK